MANITPDDVRTRFAEFRDANKYPDSLIQMYIDDSALEIDFTKWFGPRAPKAQATWVAHWLSVGEKAAAFGGGDDSTRLKASESEGDTSVSYVNPTATDPYSDMYLLSIYGRDWLMMLKQVGPPVVSTGMAHIPMPRPMRPGPFGRY